MVGDDCATQRHNLEVSYPVTNGAWRGARLGAARSHANTRARCRALTPRRRAQAS